MSKLAIRKLTPIECMILMGMTKEDALKARAVGISDSQLYKQAGNGLVTNCISEICEHIKKMYSSDFETTDEKMIRDGFGI